MARTTEVLPPSMPSGSNAGNGHVRTKRPNPVLGGNSLTRPKIGNEEPFMNVKRMLVAAVLATISLAADAGEPAKNGGWTQKQFIITFWCPPPATDRSCVPAMPQARAVPETRAFTPIFGILICEMSF